MLARGSPTSASSFAYFAAAGTAAHPEPRSDRRRQRPAALRLVARLVAARGRSTARTPSSPTCSGRRRLATSRGRRRPGLALLLAPVTLARAGRGVRHGGRPAAGARRWTAFLLCRHVTGRSGPRSPAATCSASRATCSARSSGHLHMTSVFLVPLAALVVLRFLEGELGGRGLGVRLGPLLALSSCSRPRSCSRSRSASRPGSCSGCSSPRDRDARIRRSRLRLLLAPTAGRPCSPPRSSTTRHRERLPGPDHGHEEQRCRPRELRRSRPGHVARALVDASLAEHFPTNDVERGAYLGLPLLAIVVLFAVLRARSAAGAAFSSPASGSPSSRPSGRSCGSAATRSSRSRGAGSPRCRSS